ncbi:MAG TPA: efflux RND transporter periplasmic adaptor subunit [Alphaproteobacteria bacterium]|nr:efflux RND transporter periplasmic adaptor subunit [Alphaproteobacteria bacterium]
MKKSLFIAVVIAVVATLWVLSGQFSRDNNMANSDTAGTQAPSEENLGNNDIPEVRVRDLTAQPMEDEVEVTGRTQASRQVNLKAETEGAIASILVDKGDVVKEGQILAKLALRDRAAQVLDAEQLLNQRQIQYNAAKELTEKGFNSRVRLAEARAQLEAARAQLKQAKVELANINIKAPFDAVINDQMVEIGDYVSKGNDVFELVDLDPIEITGYLTEKQIGNVSEGIQAVAELLKGEEVTGEITFIAAAADPQTRTFKMEMTLPNPEHSIKEGLTAKIKVPIREDVAYKVSPSILSLADDGTVGVKIVNDNNQVEFKPVRLLKDTPEYLWIGGLPDHVRIISVGQEFVINGQTVKPVPAEGKSLL